MTPLRRRTRGVSALLLLTQAAVLIAGALTTVVVATLVGPPLFRDHLQQAGVAHDSSEQVHAEEAYRYATAISVGVAVLAAVATALVVTWYISRRVRRSLAQLADAATQVADGRAQVRAAPLGLGHEFDSLTDAFNDMAEQLETVEATRRRLLGDLAHEIRTPVAVLDAYMEAIEDGVKNVDRPTVTVMRDQTARLVRFSEDAAALTEVADGRPALAAERLDPVDLIRTAAAVVADRAAAQGITVMTAVPDVLPAVSGDRQRLGQVLANLLDNAIRHTPPGGTITVTATADGKHLRIGVTDTGDGIAAQHLPHVFERFYRADPARARSGGGSGIGLTIAASIVDAHRGRLEVSSDGQGAGAVFTVTLPIAD